MLIAQGVIVAVGFLFYGAYLGLKYLYELFRYSRLSQQWLVKWRQQTPVVVDVDDDGTL